MIDLDAPIVPGKSAAGVFIGSVVSELLATVDAHSTTKLSSGERHDLGTVKVWAKDGVITQIGVYSGYRGVLQPGIRVGSTESSARCKPVSSSSFSVRPFWCCALTCPPAKKGFYPIRYNVPKQDLVNSTEK